MRNFLLPLSVLMLALALVPQGARALTLTFDNYNAAATAVHGIADKDAQRITTTATAGGVLGTMRTLTDAEIDTAVAAGDLAALNADFQPFDTAAGSFSLAAFGTGGVVEAALSDDTRASTTGSLGGRPVFVWLFLGASRTQASQFFLARLDTTFGTDPEDDVPLSGVVLRLRPESVARFYAGTSGPQTHDYGLGGGAAALFKMQGITAPNETPVAQNQTLRAQPGVARNGTVTGLDAEGDTLSFSVVDQPAKGTLTFNGATGAFSYTAQLSAVGQDSFTFTASDGSSTSAPATVTINIGDHGLLTQTINFPQPAQRTITTAPFAVAATASSGLPVAFQLVSGDATVSSGGTVTLTRRLVGIIVVRAIQAGNDTYAAAPPVLRSIFITAAATTPTLGHLSQTYQGVGLSPTLAGVPPGATVTMEFKTGTAAFSPALPVNAGSYQVRAVVVNGATTTTRTGLFVISKAVLTARADDKDRLIGQANPQLTATYTGFLGADDFDSVFPDPPTPTAKVPNITTTARPTSSGGFYPITLSGGAAVNYTFRFLPGRLTVRTFAGNYENLLENPALTAPGAKVDLTVAAPVRLGLNSQPNTMTCSVKLWLPTESAMVPMSGVLSIDPTSDPELLTGTCQLSRRVGTVTTTYRVSLDVKADGGMAANVFVNDVLVASGLDGRKIHVPAITPPISYAGDHTAILSPAQVLAPTANPMPGGVGHATAKIATNGVMTFAGRLGDGTLFTSSLNPTVDPTVNAITYRLFIHPYVGRKDSSFSGWLDLVPHPSLTGRYCVLAADNQRLFWAKQARSTDASYPLGIAPSSCLLTLDPWRAPTAATRTTAAITLLSRLGLAADGLFAVSHDRFTSPSYDDLPLGLKLAVTPVNRITVNSPLANLTGWRITVLNPTTGVFSGEFTLKKETPRARRVTFSGILRQPLADEGTAAHIGAAHFVLPGATSTEKATTGTLLFNRPGTP